MVQLNHCGVLPMFDIDKQIPLRSAAGVAYTSESQEGIAQSATTHLVRILRRLAERPADRSHEAATDALKPPTLCRAVLERIQALDVFAAGVQDSGALVERHRNIRGLQARVPSSTLRHALREAEVAVRERFVQLQTAITKVFDDNPAEVPDVASQVESTLAEQAWPQPTSEPHKRLSNVVTQLALLPTYEDELTPDALPRVAQSLLELGRAAADEALADVVRSLSDEEWQRQVPAFRAFLIEMNQRAARYEATRMEVLQLLEAHEHEVQQAGTDRRSSIALELAGPTADEVASGMRSAHDCSDLTHLDQKLHAEYERRMRDTVREKYPHLEAETTSFPALWVDVPSGELAALWLRLFLDWLGAGHSLYSRIESYGVEAAVEYLWRHAGPTCFFEGRAHHRFGINLTDVAFVRLPAATTAGDEKVRALLEKLFREKSENCCVTTGSVDDREVSVCRTTAGFVIGIEASNLALLQRYAEAADIGHLPHLAGLLDDSPHGEPSPRYVALAKNDVEEH